MIICTDPDDVPVDLSTPEDEPVAMIRQFQGDRYVTTASIALSNGKFRVETLTSSHTGANLTELIGEVFGISDVAATIEGYRVPDHDYQEQWQGCVPFRGRFDGALTEISFVAISDDEQHIIETYVHGIHAYDSWELVADTMGFRLSGHNVVTTSGQVVGFVPSTLETVVDLFIVTEESEVETVFRVPPQLGSAGLLYLRIVAPNSPLQIV